MNIEEIKTASKETIEVRASQILDELKNVDSEGLKLLSAELDAIEARRKELQKEVETAKNDAAAVAEGKGVEIRTFINNEGEKTMNKEFRNSEAYIDALANAIKTDDYKELRTLVTENAPSAVKSSESNGVIPVPDFVEEVVNTNWKKLSILDKCKFSEIKGNIRVQFELSSTDAAVHQEGTDAPDEEVLKLGIVTITPSTIKKHISLSDEIMDLDSQAFLTYIYKELSYRIFKKAEDDAVQAILDAPTTATASAANVQEFEQTGAPALGDFITAAGMLSDEVTNPVIVCSRATEAYYKTLALDANYPFNPFDGMEVLYSNKLADASASLESGCYAIIGDFDGLQANFPKGKALEMKVDPYTEATKDLVRFIGRLPVGFGIVACDRFVRLVKAE